MITVAGRIPIRPEMTLRAVAAALELMRASRTDLGCLQYHFYSDLEDPNMLHVFEEWESAEELAAHLAQDHTTKFLAALGEMISGTPVVKRYVVSESGSLL